MKTVGDIDKVVDQVAKDFNSDIHPRSVFVSGLEREIGLSLSKRALSYVNVGMNNKPWNDLSLRIYDSYSRYKLHYERLVYILNKLDIALTAGEEWGTDSSFSFMSVDTYKCKDLYLLRQ